MRRRERRRLAHDVMRAGESRRARRRIIDALQYAESTGRRGGFLGNLAQRFGPIGRFVGALAEIFTGGEGRPGEADVQDAIDLLENAGYRVLPPEPTPPPIQRPIAASPPPVAPQRGAQPGGIPRPPGGPGRPAPAAPRPTGPGRPRVDPSTPPVPPSRPSPPAPAVRLPTPEELERLLRTVWPEEHDIETRKLSAPMLADSEVWKNEIETPESSNVYAFAYDEEEGILYVTYKAPGRVDPGTGARPHVRGPMYSYGGRARPVPKEVYEGMRSAASKGRFVWDRLRVRGTIWGHQYPYTLVSPSMAGGELYVPRKATRRGFRVRSVATVAPVRRPPPGRRRRPFDRSTLPERLIR